MTAVRARCGRLALMAALGAVACERPVPPIPAEPPPQAGTATPRGGVKGPEPAPTGKRWSSEPPSSVVAEMQGKPLAMEAGARCKTFRSLPSLRYRVDTLVTDACLEIPSGTTIEIRDRSTLVIVATNGLLLGRNVTVVAAGLRGRRGARAQFASIPFVPETDAEIQALCLDSGNQCACPRAEQPLAALRGQAGEPGVAGGGLRLVAGELISPSQLAGLDIDVSGGVGGPPGESGTQQCVRGRVSCSSPACSSGVGFGLPGAAGAVLVTLGAPGLAGSLERIKRAVTPAEAARVNVARGAALTDEVTALAEEALRKGWERKAGEARYANNP